MKTIEITENFKIPKTCIELFIGDSIQIREQSDDLLRMTFDIVKAAMPFERDNNGEKFADFMIDVLQTKLSPDFVQDWADQISNRLCK